MSPRFLRGKPKRRSQGPGFLRQVTVTAIQIGLLGTLLWAGWWSWHRLTDPHRFPVRDIVVEGAERADIEAVASRLEGARGRNLLTLDLDPFRRAVEAESWVRRAVLHRRLPATLAVEIEERTVAAWARVENRRVYVDPEGRVITEVPAGGSLAGPGLTGLDDLQAPARGPRLRAGVAALEAVREAGPAFAAEIETIDLSDPRRLVLRMRAGAELWLPMERSPRNLARWIRLRERIVDTVGPIRYADLRWSGQIAVMPVEPGGVRRRQP